MLRCVFAGAVVCLQAMLCCVFAGNAVLCVCRAMQCVCKRSCVWALFGGRDETRRKNITSGHLRVNGRPRDDGTFSCPDEWVPASYQPRQETSANQRTGQRAG